MNSQRIKQLAAVAMIASVGALWIPQVLERMNAPAPGGFVPADEDPLDEDSDEDMGLGDPESESGGDSAESSELLAPEQTIGGDPVLAGLSDMLRLLRGTPESMQAVAQPVVTESTQAPVLVPSTNPTEFGSDKPKATFSNTLIDPRVGDFIDSHQLRATLLSKSGDGVGSALWGGMLVSAGDTFMDGEIRVDSIQKGYIVLSVSGRKLEVGLPEFQVSTSDSSSDDAVDSSSEPATEDDGITITGEEDGA